MRTLTAAALLVTAPALAQTQTPQPMPVPVEETSRDVSVTVAGGYLFQFDTDFDNSPGSIEVQRAYGVVGAGLKLTPGLDLGLRFAWEGAWYDWDGQSKLHLGGTSRPWSDPQAYQVGAQLGMRIDTQWSAGVSIFGSSAGESGADFGDTLSMGGTWCVTWRPDPNFMIGGGMLVATQIEDDALILPLFYIDWRITDGLRLTNQAGPEAYPTGVGLELIWTPTENLDLAVGGRYEKRRFRLDDGGPAPDGIGEDTSFGLWGRVGIEFSSQLRADFLFGGMLGEELRLENSSGHRLADADLDPSPFLALFVSFRF